MKMRDQLWASTLCLFIALGAGCDNEDDDSDTSGGGEDTMGMASTTETPTSTTTEGGEAEGGEAEGEGGTTEAATTEGGADTEAGEAGGSGMMGDSECLMCIEDTCGTELETCLAEEDCTCVWTCVQESGQGAAGVTQCVLDCELEALPEDAAALAGCVGLNCSC